MHVIHRLIFVYCVAFITFVVGLLRKLLPTFFKIVTQSILSSMWRLNSIFRTNVTPMHPTRDVTVLQKYERGCFRDDSVFMRSAGMADRLCVKTERADPERMTNSIAQQSIAAAAAAAAALERSTSLSDHAVDWNLSRQSTRCGTRSAGSHK